MKREYQPPEIKRNCLPFGTFSNHPDQPQSTEHLKYAVVRALLLSESGRLVLARRPKSSKLDPGLWSFIGGKVDLFYPSSTGITLIQTSEVEDIGFSEREWKKVWGESFGAALRRELAEELRIDGGEMRLELLSSPSTLDAYFANQTMTVIMLITISDHQLSQIRLTPKPITEQMTDLTNFSLDMAPVENMAFEYAGDFLRYLQGSSPETIPRVIQNAVLRIGVLVNALPLDILSEIISDRTTSRSWKLFSKYQKTHTKLNQLLVRVYRSNNLQPDQVTTSLSEALKLSEKLKQYYIQFMNSNDTDLTELDHISASISRLAQATKKLIRPKRTVH